jgi:hypothetical protein
MQVHAIRHSSHQIDELNRPLTVLNLYIRPTAKGAHSCIAALQPEDSGLGTTGLSTMELLLLAQILQPAGHRAHRHTCKDGALIKSDERTNCVYRVFEFAISPTEQQLASLTSLAELVVVRHA